MADHDQRFKLLIQEFFREFFLLFYPEWASYFDFDRVEWLTQETFLDPPQGERQYIDLVAKLPTNRPVQVHAGTPEHFQILIHIEIEAPDSVAAVPGRMFDYYRQLRQRHDLPVLPIGLYLHVGLEGIGWDEYEEWFLDHRLVHFEYAYVGLPALDAFQYLEGNNWLGVALAVLMRIPEHEKARFKARALHRLATCPENAARRFLLCECVEAYLPLVGPQLAEYDHLLLSEEYKEARMVGQTSFERGIETGVERGQRALIERQLQTRFGPLSETLRDRLAKWPTERLAELGDALLTAQSLQELGLED